MKNRFALIKAYESQKLLDDLKQISKRIPFIKEKDTKKNCIEKGEEPTLHTHHTQHQKTLNLGSYHTASVKDDDDLHWGPRPTQ